MALVDVYRAVIFDYGGVLVEHQTDADQAQLAAIAGISKDVFFDLYWADRLEYDRAALTGVQYWQGIARNAGAPFTEEQVEKLIAIDVASWMHFDPPMWEWVDQLRASGKRAGMLSNMPREVGEALKLEQRKLSSFDQITLSYEVRSVKPDAPIYEHCLEELGVAPEEALFLDDRIANVQAAEVLGIRAVQFTSRDEMLLKLRS